MTDHHKLGLTALFGLLWIIYALSPGGLGSMLSTLAIAALAVSAAVAVSVWDELRLLWAKKRR